LFLPRCCNLRCFSLKATKNNSRYADNLMAVIKNYSHKKTHIDGSSVQTPVNRFRANRLLKDPLQEGLLLQPKLTLFKQISVEFVKN